MTDEMERQAEAIFAHLDDLGQGSILEGVYVGIENGYFVGEIADSAYRFEREVNNGNRIIVGVNDFTDGDDSGQNILRIDASVEEYQRKRLADVKLARDDDAVTTALGHVTSVAADPAKNLMPPIIDAVKAYATLEEISMAMEKEFGTYVEKAII
jgi:methylmalonyl-CoA mutase N-terminal domain/subunit